MVLHGQHVVGIVDPLAVLDQELGTSRWKALVAVAPMAWSG